MSVNLSGLTILIWFSTIKCLACAQDQIWINSPIQYVLSLLYIHLKTILRVDIYFSHNCQTAYPETLGYAPLVVLMLREKWVSIVATVDLHSGIKYCYLVLQRGWKSLGCPVYRTRSSEPNSRHLHRGNCYYFQSEVQDRPMDFHHSLMGGGDKVFCPSLLHLLAGYIQFFPNDTPSSSLSVHTGKLTSSM